ncbi:MAG TPA: DUF2993 domain-containing protein [Egibacteraceae bacterium]|nr:DUF2993 domain-containing protein [Egibacteraceae bacterium]
MRRLGCLLFVLILLAGIAVGADFLITRLIEQRTEEQVSAALETPADVTLHGWPVTLRLIEGVVPRATVTATDVPLENNVTLSRLDVVLHDVQVRLSELGQQSEEVRLPPARSGEFEAELTEEAVAGVLGLPDAVSDVRLADGLVHLSAAGLEVSAEVGARDGDVVVSLAGPLAQVFDAEYPIDLSNEPGAPAVEEVAIRDGVMVLRGSLEDVER